MIPIRKVFLALCLLAFAADLFGSLENSRKNVVFIGSYQDNHIWTGKVRDAFERALKSSEFDVYLRNIYLDSKNISDRDVRRRMLAAMLKSGAKADVVVASDLEAAEAIVDVCKAERYGQPVVLVSVWEGESPLKNVVVCGAEVGVDETFCTARKMVPRLEKVYVLADNTDTGRFYMRAAKRQLEKYSREVEFIYNVNADSADDFLESANGLPANSAVILLTWQRDDNGVYHNPQIIYPALAKVCNAPVFTVIDNMIECGFVGGYSLKASENGRIAAERALEIIRKGSAGDCKSITTIPPVPVFNHEALSRWNIDEALIPPGSAVVNEPPSFISEYFPPIVLSGAFVGLLVGITAVVFFLYGKYRRLAEKNMALYRRLENVLSALPVGVETYDDSGFLINANDADKVIFGMSGRRESLVGSLNIFKDPNLSEDIKSAVRNSKPVESILMYDFDSVSSAGYFETSLRGKKRIVCRGAPIFPQEGEKRCYVLAFLDLTAEISKSRSLEALKNSLDLAMAACGACVWYMDVKTYEFEILSGPAETLFFRDLEEFFYILAPETRARTRKLFDEILSGKMDRNLLLVSYRDSESGEFLLAEISMAGVSKGGSVIGVVGTLKKLSDSQGG